MKFQETELAGAFVVELEPFTDERGWFARTYCQKEFAEIGVPDQLVQINHSFNATKGTTRGLHFQNPPFAEVKLIRVIAGAIYDVIVDLRRGSPTFLKHVAVELSAENRKMLLVPKGFAHGFQTLTDGAELLYHHTEFYEPGHEGGIKYDDPAIGIQWPMEATVMSDRDKEFNTSENFSGLEI